MAGPFDTIARKAGKELVDVLQEAIDSENRIADTLTESFGATSAMQELKNTIKVNGLDARRAIIQALVGGINDAADEDFSLDKPYTPGSDQ